MPLCSGSWSGSEITRLEHNVLACPAACDGSFWPKQMPRAEQSSRRRLCHKNVRKQKYCMTRRSSLNATSLYAAYFHVFVLLQLRNIFENTVRKSAVHFHAPSMRIYRVLSVAMPNGIPALRNGLYIFQRFNEIHLQLFSRMRQFSAYF